MQVSLGIVLPVFIKKNFKIIGVDSLNDYYNLKLKKRRIKLLKAKNFTFLREDLASKKILMEFVMKI